MTRQIASDSMMRYGKTVMKEKIQIIDTLDLPERFVFFIKPVSMPEPPSDNMFQVNKKTGKVSEFQPDMDLENFKKAMGY